MKRFLIFSVLLVLISLSIATTIWAQEPVSPSTPTPGSIEGQIVGGTKAALGDWPWQVAIVDATQPNPQDGQSCGGSLIGPDWVLTAGHCVHDEDGNVQSPNTIDVVVGIIKLSTGPTSGSTGQRRHVTQIIPHPAYNNTTLDSDLALLRLAAPVTFNSTVGLIEVVDSGDAALFAPGQMSIVTGWGNLGNDTYPDDLYQVSAPIVTNATCNVAMGGVTANMLCAGYAVGGKDSCDGDSGGPLVVSDGIGGWRQAGVVSWGGTPCALPNEYGVYTRLSQFKAWIASYLPANLSTSSKTVAPANAEVGQVVTYTVRLNNNDLVSMTTAITDILPVTLELQGSPTVSSGSVPTVNGQTITWQGIITENTVITITYAAMLTSTTTATPTVVNSVLISGGNGQTYLRQAFVNGYYQYLPIILR